MVYELEQRCVAMLGDLYHAEGATAAEDGTRQQLQCVGTSTIGSSEGIMLAGLAMKKRWQQRRRAAGLSTDRPNLIFGSYAQACHL